MKKRVGILLGIIVFFIGAYAIQGISSGDKKKGEVVKIGYFPNVTHAPALIAKNQKKYEDSLGEGVTVEWKQFNDGPAAVEAIFANEIDLSYIGPGPAVTAYTKSNGAVKVLSGVTDGGAIIVANKDSKIDSVEDLAGKIVAVPKLGNTQDVTLRGLLKDKNIEGTEIVQGKNADIQNLLDTNQIDAAFVPEPWGSLVENNGDAKVVLDNEESYKNGDYPTTVLIGRQEYIDKNKEVVKKLLDIQDKTIEEINGDKDESAKILIEELKELTGKDFERKIIDKSFARMKFTNKIDKSELKEILDIFVESGKIEKYDDLEGIIVKVK